MSTEENEDVQMDFEESCDQFHETIDPTRITPRVLIAPREEFTFRPHPDGTKEDVASDWATEKESELAKKERKARRKEKHKEKKNGSPKVLDVAEATDIPKATIKVSKPKDRKRKSEVAEEGASKRKVSLEKAPQIEPGIRSAPPIKRKDMSQEQRSVQNKQKREATKTKKKSAKATTEQPVPTTEEGDKGKGKAVGG